MRILMKSGTTEQILCHGAVVGVDKHVGPQDLTTSGPVSAQVAQFLRGTTGKSYNRKGLISRIAFAVTRECASAQAAESFCLTHLRDVLRESVCLLLCQDGRGGWTTLTLADATLEDVQCRQIGVSVIINYTIVGGTLT